MSDAVTRLRTTGERLHGARWQTALARDLNVSDRRVRQWLAGDPIPAGVLRDLERLETEKRGWPRDEWIIGTDAEGSREYIIHTRAPRFVARLAQEDGHADLLTGITYACGSGETLCEVAWIDAAPMDEPSLLDLFQRAETAIDIYTADSAEASP
jgi:hypothetical protein